MLYPLHSGSGEKCCLQLLDSADRKPILCAGRKTTESNRSGWVFVFVMGMCPLNVQSLLHVDL